MHGTEAVRDHVKLSSRTSVLWLNTHLFFLVKEACLFVEKMFLSRRDSSVTSCQYFFAYNARLNST